MSQRRNDTSGSEAATVLPVSSPTAMLVSAPPAQQRFAGTAGSVATAVA
ncbi:hypothetical protein [Bilophila wadsworthia]